MKLVVEQGENEYRIVAWNSAVGNPDKPDYEGDFVEYGEIAELQCGADMYMAICDRDDKTGEVESLLPIDDWACLCKKCGATVEDVEIEGDEPDVEAAIAEIEGGDEDEDSEDDGGEEEDEGHDA